MKRYVVVGGILAFVAFGVMYGKYTANGWRTVHWGEPQFHQLETFCIERKVVPDPDRYQGTMSVCVATKELEVGTLNVSYTTWDGALPEVTTAHIFGMAGEDLYLVLAKEDTVTVRNLDRTVVGP